MLTLVGPHRNGVLSSSIALFGALCLLLAASDRAAAQITAGWIGNTGGGTSSNWSDSVNWDSGEVPLSADNALFIGPGGPTTNLLGGMGPNLANFVYNDIVGLSINSITFTTNNDIHATIITGNPITLLSSGTAMTKVTGGQSMAIWADIIMGNNQTWSLAGQTVTNQGVLSDSGNGFRLIKAGNSTLRFENTNNTTGGYTINAGTVRFTGSDAAFGPAPLTFVPNYIIINNATLQLATNRGNGWTDAGMLGGNFTIDPNRGIQLGAANNNPGTIDVAAGTITYDGVISGGGTTNRLIKAGAQILQLGGTNTFGGGVRINAGTLRVTADEALGPVPGAFDQNHIQLNGGTLEIGGLLPEIDPNRGISIGFTNNNGSFNGTIAVQTSSNLASYHGVIGFHPANNPAVVTNRIINLIKTGAGTLHLGGANEYNGFTLISAGYMTPTSNLGSNGFDGVIFNGGGFRITNDFELPLATIPLGTNNNGNAVFFVEPGATFTYNGGAFNNHTNPSAANALISKNGLGTMILGGDLNFFGGIQVSNGVLIITGTNNTYSGPTLAAGGATSQLAIDGPQNLGLGPLVLNGGGVLITNTWSWDVPLGLGSNNNNGGFITVAAGQTWTVNGPIIQNTTNRFTVIDTNLMTTNIFGFNQTGGLTKNGPGTLVINNTNNYNGNTTINEGILRLGVNEALYNNTGSNNIRFTSNVVVNAGTFDLNGFAQSVRGLTLGAGAEGTTAIVETGGGTLLIGAGNLTRSPSNSLMSVISGTNGFVLLEAGNRTFTVNDSPSAPVDLRIEAIITNDVAPGARTLTKAGPGVLELASPPGANSFSNVTINNGILLLGANEQITDGRSVTLDTAANVPSATFDVSGFTETIGALTFTGQGGTNPPTMDVIGSGTLRIAGNITKNVGNATNHALTSTISVGTLGIIGADRTFAVNNSTNADVDLRITSTILGDPAGTRSITKTGLGTLELASPSGANSFSNFTIQAGVVRLGTNEQLPNLRTLAIQNGEFALQGFNETVGALTLGGFSSTNPHQAVISGTGTLTIGGTLTFNAGTNTAQSSAAIVNAPLNLGAANRTFTINDSVAADDDVIINTAITSDIAGARIITKNGLGTLLLNAPPGASSFSNLVIQAGTVKLGNHDQITDGRTVDVQNGTFNIQSFNDTIGALSLGGFNTTNVMHQASIIGTGMLTLGGSVTYNAGTNTIQSLPATIGVNLPLGGASRTFTVNDSTNATEELTITGVISGANNITKAGTGTLVLTATNTYEQTTVNAGRLLINGTSGTGPVIVNSNAVLGGTGTLLNTLSVNTGGAVNPGASAGTLTVDGNVSFNDGSIFQVELFSASVFDQLIANAGVSLNGGNIEVLLDPGFSADIGTVFTLIDKTSDGAIAGTLTRFGNLAQDETITIGAYEFEADYFGGTGNDFTLTVIVPEPGTITLMSLGGLLLGWQLLRRRRRS